MPPGPIATPARAPSGRSELGGCGPVGAGGVAMTSGYADRGEGVALGLGINLKMTMGLSDCLLSAYHFLLLETSNAVTAVSSFARLEEGMARLFL